MNFEYNPETAENLKNVNLEKIEKRENELSLDEKQYLIENWKVEVVDGPFGVEEVKQIDNRELRQNLNQSLMGDIKQLSDEWGIKPNKDLPEKDYIEEIRIRINDLAKKAEGDTHWDSWPKRMREDEGFNCVGATLLGISALKEKGIESYYGTPWGHAVNIVFSSGNWMYADFRNNVIKEIYPEEIILAGHRILKIDDEDIDYKLIPIYDNSLAVGSIIGNLSGLEAEKGNEERQAIYQNIKQKLFPEFKENENTEEMQIEKERVESIQEAERKAKDYLTRLSKENRKEVVQEIINKKELIRGSMLNEELVGKFSNELYNFLRLLINELSSITKKEVKKEVIDRFLRKVTKL